MKKHIIFTGSEFTGKTLFAKLIFGHEITAYINGRGDLLSDDFIFDFDYREDWNYVNIVIDDPKPTFNIESFYHLLVAPQMCVNRQGRRAMIVETPRFIFILDSKIELPNDSSFHNRFRVIDFDKNSIADLTKMIKEENIIIEAARF